jgi:metal-sulfur cluster biosynthetic enzyme
MSASACTSTVADIWKRLGQIIDPELGCNIVDLGLVYEVVLFEDRVRVEMTLTSRVCPMGDILVAAVKSTLHEMPGVKRAEVHLVWDPAWTVGRMSSAAREQLGVPADA